MGEISRREVLRMGAAGALCVAIPEPVRMARSVIVLRMDGGPSQFDTWAPSEAGPWCWRSTSANGVWYCEHMPRLAGWAHRIAVFADVVVPEINHKRARYLMRTGGPAPPSVLPDRLIQPPDRRDSDAAPARYGDSEFGRQCFAALRLVENGAPYADAVLPGWDTHTDNEPRVRRLLAAMDPAMSALLADLDTGGLLGTTLVVWMGEFGRTHAINRSAGRDHDPSRTCIVLAGAGVRGGTLRRGAPTPVSDVFATVAALSPLYPSARYARRGEPIASALA